MLNSMNTVKCHLLHVTVFTCMASTWGHFYHAQAKKKKENKNSFSHYTDYTFVEGLLLGMQVLIADKFSSNST